MSYTRYTRLQAVLDVSSDISYALVSILKVAVWIGVIGFLFHAARFLAHLDHYIK